MPNGNAPFSKRRIGWYAVATLQGTDQTIGEEIANSISHGVGAALAIAGLVLLTIRAAQVGGVRYIVCSAIFGASAILLYLSSTLYHSLSRTRAYRVMRSLDHGSIYLLIAGTYTPFTLIGLRGALGWTLFAVVWSCALIGVIVKAVAVHKFAVVSTVMYLAMGWAAIFAVKSMYLLLWLIRSSPCCSEAASATRQESPSTPPSASTCTLSGTSGFSPEPVATSPPSGC